MQVFRPKLQNFLTLKNAATIHLTRVFASSTPFTNNSAPFHSTAASFQKRKPNFNFVKGEKQERPPKNYIRYTVRERRSASKKALRDLLFNTSFSRSGVQGHFSRIEADDANRFNKKSRIKPGREARRAYRKKVKSKRRREKFEDFEEHDFDWGETSGHGYFRNRKYKSQSGMRYKFKIGMEIDEAPYIIGSAADRRTLGLPLAGQIKIEDVKAAFRLSALKWHPDKNPGSSRAEAAEKFKLCADAYKSLCGALSEA